MLWKKVNFQVAVLDCNSQSITVSISWPGFQCWLLINWNICQSQSQHYCTRQGLWNYFSHFSTTHHLPWVVVGDFNESPTNADKNGGPYTGKFGGLKMWVQSSGMIDLGYQGADFTWSNGKVEKDWI